MLKKLVCCKFYQENIRVCAKKSECKSIESLTKEIKSTQTSTSLQTSILNKEGVRSIESSLNITSNMLLLLVGILLIILGLIIRRKYTKKH